MAGRSHVLLRLYPVGPRVADRERAARIVERLASRRRVSEGMGEWRVLFDTGDVSEAMGACEADLAAVDPGWVEVLDFAAVAARPNLVRRLH
jgi:hypothetical protein